ncbi:MAG: hypothetical protein JW902_16935 [Syntrophaceae bacterium]|nr:hypothetical protein [Syntrophaceae bacterium]
MNPPKTRNLDELMEKIEAGQKIVTATHTIHCKCGRTYRYTTQYKVKAGWNTGHTYTRIYACPACSPETWEQSAGVHWPTYPTMYCALKECAVRLASIRIYPKGRQIPMDITFDYPGDSRQ